MACLPRKAHEVISQDFPYREDCPVKIPGKYEENYYEVFHNAHGIKFGGWPTLIQGEVFWTPLQDSAAGPAFAFRIDSVEKAKWQWDDCGVAYFGRGTKPGKEDAWTFAWQCF